MDRSRFVKLATEALEHIEDRLAAIEHEDLDVELAGDVLTISFSDGARFIINAHSAAGQIWMAADRSAWHFDWDEARGRWIASQRGDELMATVAGTVGARLGQRVEI